MNARLLSRVSRLLFALLGIFYLAFGALYAGVDGYLPFHAAALPAEGRETFAPLYLALVKLIGGASIGLALLGLWTAVSVRSRAAIVAVTLAYATPLVVAAYVAETLRMRTGAPTSWHIMGALLALLLVAAVSGLVALRRPGAR